MYRSQNYFSRDRLYSRNRMCRDRSYSRDRSWNYYRSDYRRRDYRNDYYKNDYRDDYRNGYRDDYRNDYRGENHRDFKDQRYERKHRDYYDNKSEDRYVDDYSDSSRDKYHKDNHRNSYKDKDQSRDWYREDSYDLGRGGSREKPCAYDERKVTNHSKLELVNNIMQQLDPNKDMTIRFMKAVSEDVNDLFENACSLADVKCYIVERLMYAKTQRLKHWQKTPM